MHPNDSHWKYRLTRALYILGVLASLVLIVSFSFEAFSASAFAVNTVYSKIQLGVCVYFLLDFVLLLWMAEHRTRFVFKGLPLLLLSIPYSFLIHHSSLELSSEALYAIRFLPIIRGAAALAMLVRMIVGNRISGLFITYLAVFFAITYFQTLIFYVFEANVNPLVKSYPDALWWASMTVTTVGSNIVPATTVGKFCTATLAVVGMTTFPIFTAYITAVIHGWSEREKKRSESLSSVGQLIATVAHSRGDLPPLKGRLRSGRGKQR